MKRLLAIFLYFIALQAFAANAYKWIDEKGNVHFGNIPPNQGAKQLRLPHEKEHTLEEKPEAIHDKYEALKRRQAEEMRRTYGLEVIEREIQKEKARRDLEERIQKADEHSKQKKCQYLKDRIERIEERKRHGYTASEGVYLDKRKERYKKELREHCR